MSKVEEQYEAYPYPERDPKDEKKRLVTGSPSHPLEIDHFVFGGRRDWTKPLKALVAGGGTGDALIMLAQVLTTAGRPYEITYLDLSKASREIAEARAAVRGLKGITFRTESLFNAAEYGPFDYVDCCGVLHHLSDPVAGFASLAAALKPDGGLGFMVYAPYGRSGVYPLQEAFGTLYGDLPPEAKLAAAQEMFAKLPKGHPFNTNPHLVDHAQSEAGFYDLLLHSQDQAFDVGKLLNTLDQAGLELSGFATPGLYDLGRLAEVPAGMTEGEAMALAEKLNGTIKTHVGYARLAGQGVALPRASDMVLIPHLPKAPAQALAAQVAKCKPVRITLGGIKINETFPREAAPLIAAIDGQRNLAALAALTGLDPVGFASLWGPVQKVLTDWGLLQYSTLLAGGNDVRTVR